MTRLRDPYGRIFGATHRAVLIAHLDIFGSHTFRLSKYYGVRGTRFRQAAMTLVLGGLLEMSDENTTQLTPAGREALAELLGQWADRVFERQRDESKPPTRLTLHYRAEAKSPRNQPTAY